MWGENWLGRTARKIAAGAVESGLERLAAAVRSSEGERSVPVLVVLPNGSRIAFGDAPPSVTLIVRDEATVAEFANPTLATLGEAFVAGRLDVEGDIAEAIKLAEKLAESGGAPVAARVAAAMNRHTAKRDRADITHHYDVGNDFYRLWLDERMVYSCAYFRTGDESIDEAQAAKLDHICRKLRLQPGERLLDVGCGWGGLILHAVQNYGVRAVGITLSQAQLDVAREQIARAGVADRCEALLLDYREAPARFGAGSFDKASSIGMFEHVGLRNMPQYCSAVRDVLRERGLFLNHGITSADVENRPIGSGVAEFIDKYVFPNGELPHLHFVVREMSAAGLEVCDVESLRPHYARTLAHWSQRLEARLQEARSTVAERTLRVWRVYLAGSSWGFAQNWMNIYQVLGSRQTQPGPTALPLTRAWMYS